MRKGGGGGGFDQYINHKLVVDSKMKSIKMAVAKFVPKICEGLTGHMT